MPRSSRFHSRRVVHPVIHPVVHPVVRGLLLSSVFLASACLGWGAAQSGRLEPWEDYPARSYTGGGITQLSVYLRD